MGRRVSESLRLQLLCVVLASIVAGAAVFGTSFILGRALLDTTVYGRAFAGRMADLQFSKLQDYVAEEGVTRESLQRLNAWCSRSKQVYLVVYQNDAAVYESQASAGQNGEAVMQELDPNAEDPASEYELILKDGERTRAFLYYHAGDAFYFGMTAIAGALAFLSSSLCFVALTSRKTAYIAQLKEELDILSGGQLEHPVTISGRDELAELASGIDQMRQSIIKHQELEKRMRSANSELITEMSHDLRTPLTSLLAYLEIIDRKKYRDPQQMEDLIRKSIDQTMRIRHMADELFTYFLAYSTEWDLSDMETLDADLLFRQMLDDCGYALESKGMRVEVECARLSSKVIVDVGLMRRVLDNLCSNILKYGDSDGLVRFSVKREGDELLLSVSNPISSCQHECESTGVGLIACRRIVEYHGGRFAVGGRGNCFGVSISIPVAN